MSWKVPENWNEALLRTFLRDFCHISKRGLADIKFNGGCITLNGEEVTVRKVIETNDLVHVYLPPEETSPSLRPEKGPFEIVYEDDHVLVINKEAGIATIPSREHPTNTLANFVLDYYESQQIKTTFHAVNRLDKDTSGLLIIAKHRLAHDRLSKLQQAKHVQRYYRAIVSGKLHTDKGTIDAPIARDPESIISRKVCQTGKRAITHYIVTNELEHSSVVDIKLETGRTHQIRVHFSYLGHPLLGDDLYGGDQQHIKRQALHCYKLEFQHPFKEKLICLTSNLPNDMAAIKNEGDLK